MRKLVISGAWAAYATYMFYNVMRDQHGSFMVFLFEISVLGWLPFALSMRMEARRWRRRSELLALAGLEAGTPFSNFCAGGGVALNIKTKKIYLLSEKSMKGYGYDEMRRWDRRVDGLGVLNFEMRDVEHPHWQVLFLDVAESVRWTEMLEQEINEGGLAEASRRQ